MRTDVVVCGAGVGGLAAAHALGSLGLRVLLVDKQAEPTTAAKGEVLQPGALKILSEWGVTRRLQERGALRLSHLVARDPEGRPQMSLEYDRLPGEANWLLAHDYPAILAALADGLAPTVDFRRGVLVRGPLRDGTGRICGVTLSEGGPDHDVHAALIVAADGISSRLRREAGIEVHRQEYPHRLVAFDIHDAPPTEPDFSAYVSGRGLRLRYPLPGGRVRLYVQTAPDELRGLDKNGLLRWTDRLLSEVPGLAPLGDALPAALDSRQALPVSRFLAPRLAAPGLALVGESGHTVHPMAAQGMNSSVCDAHCLAGVIGALSGDLTPSGVDTALRAYESERLPNLAHTGRTSHNAARMITDLSWAGRTLGRRAMRHTGANSRLRYTVMHNMAGLGIHELSLLDRLHQVGLLPDPRARQLPAWA
ncbi:FAD-dependent oxidoreductase [Streptomyces pseudovenezuelae]|uniref:2-polyprenyl-6-methoxyphenol hydroxylase-like FAD-dependent oxidoreductase n=1 Tax=Streptomyces pseudovenezuelae TaxID=67350 RepID=A0ABT6LYW9_9ACTN|nr:NAD(P)/FAD-dependent oxidoreductase [Streptomyces pseudovenezuelae]MDH6221428.1 2-polyprenyl-6-methoxyphenol hydroxylase-like FAD-dependent oxidoreductase [Streptomyces pseudovenezuelae]